MLHLLRVQRLSVNSTLHWFLAETLLSRFNLLLQFQRRWQFFFLYPFSNLNVEAPIRQISTHCCSPNDLNKGFKRLFEKRFQQFLHKSFLAFPLDLDDTFSFFNLFRFVWRSWCFWALSHLPSTSPPTTNSPCTGKPSSSLCRYQTTVGFWIISDGWSK